MFLHFYIYHKCKSVAKLLVAISGRSRSRPPGSSPASLPRLALTLFPLTLPLFMACVAPSRPPSFPDSTHAPHELPVRAWWSMSSTALGDLAHAPDYGINTLIIQNNTQVNCDAAIDALALYDFSDRFRKTGADRDQTEKLRVHYRAITDEAKRRGVECYLFSNEIFPPKGMGVPSYDDPALWTVIRERLREVFRALPDIRGYLLYFCEGPVEVVHLPGAEPSQAKRIRKLIDTAWEACRAEHRRLVVTTFIHRPETLEAIAEACRGFPPDPEFWVLQYCCPNDWGCHATLNPAIGRCGPHPEILGFDYAAENWGRGAHAFVQTEFMARRLREARARNPNIAGLIGYVSWHTSPSIFGTFDEANIAAAGALCRDPGRDGGEILHDWCAKRFGEPAADVAAACLGRTQDIIMKAQHVAGFWVDTGNKSGLPSLQEVDDYFFGDYWGEALAKWDPAFQPAWDRIQAPDEAFLADVLKEKDEAIALGRRSREELRAARDRFRPEDFAALERVFVFQEVWARLWRDAMHAAFLRRIARREGWTPERRERLSKVLDQMNAGADELEAQFGKDCFPDGPGRARSFIREVLGRS